MYHRPLGAQARHLCGLPIENLVELAGQFLRLPESHGGRNRKFTPWRTFWLFLSQVLGPTRVCREVVRKAQAWFLLKKDQNLSSSTSAYCQARSRLPQKLLDDAFRQIRDSLAEREAPIWMGRSVKVVDGTCISMPDTPDNQKLYPQSSRQKRGCGFPIMRLVVVFSLSCGAILGMEKGALSVHERTLWHRLWALMEKGCVVLADRGFCGFADFWWLMQRGVDSVMRLHQKRSVGLRKIRRLAKGDWLVEWKKTAVCPKWMTREEWSEMPEVIRVRHIDVQISIPGFRTHSLTLATTILDHKAFPAKAFSDLYRQRWLAEIFLRDIKITMGMDILRCLKPSMIHKELTMHLIAYNLVRALMREAAIQNDVDPLRISLAGSLAAIRQWAPTIAAAHSNRKRRILLEAFFRCIASDIVPFRPNRYEPRAKKRRAKNYQLLTKPRACFKEIPHRSKYFKSLS